MLFELKSEGILSMWLVALEYIMMGGIYLNGRLGGSASYL